MSPSSLCLPSGSIPQERMLQNGCSAYALKLHCAQGDQSWKYTDAYVGSRAGTCIFSLQPGPPSRHGSNGRDALHQQVDPLGWPHFVATEWPRRYGATGHHFQFSNPPAWPSWGHEAKDLTFGLQGGPPGSDGTCGGKHNYMVAAQGLCGTSGWGKTDLEVWRTVN